VGAIHGEPLVQVLQNMTDEAVELIPKEKELVIRAQRKKVGIRMERTILLPTESVTAPDKWIPLEPGFGDAVGKVAGASGTNEEEFKSICIQVAPTCLEACDRTVACRYEFPTGITKPFLVKAKYLSHAKSLDFTKLGETQDWLHLRNKSLIFSIRRYHDEWFPTDVLWQFRGTPMKLPRGSDEAAKLGHVFTRENKEDDKVTVFLRDGHMLVRGEGTRGWAECSPECDYSGDPVSFRISPDMLETLVKEHETCEIGPKKLRVAGEKWTFVSVLGEVGEDQRTSESSEE
jgi:hypothetical protein